MPTHSSTEPQRPTRSSDRGQTQSRAPYYQASCGPEAHEKNGRFLAGCLGMMVIADSARWAGTDHDPTPRHCRIRNCCPRKRKTGPAIETSAVKYCFRRSVKKAPYPRRSTMIGPQQHQKDSTGHTRDGQDPPTAHASSHFAHDLDVLWMRPGRSADSPLVAVGEQIAQAHSADATGLLNPLFRSLECFILRPCRGLHERRELGPGRPRDSPPGAPGQARRSTRRNRVPTNAPRNAPKSGGIPVAPSA